MLRSKDFLSLLVVDVPTERNSAEIDFMKSFYYLLSLHGKFLFLVFVQIESWIKANF